MPYLSLVDVTTFKGRHADDYSGFRSIDEAGHALPELLREAGASDVDICGFAADKCVAATVQDSSAAGFTTKLLIDLSGVADPAGWDEVLAALRPCGARVESRQRVPTVDDVSPQIAGGWPSNQRPHERTHHAPRRDLPPRRAMTGPHHRTGLRQRSD